MRYAIAASLLLALVLPAAAEGHCRRYSNKATLGTPVIHKVLFSTTMSTTWCFDGRRVTRLGRTRLTPALSRLGTLAGWEFRGAASGERWVDRRGAYRVRRVVHWRRCTARCFHCYVEMVSVLGADGRARRHNRVRRS